MEDITLIDPNKQLPVVDPEEGVSEEVGVLYEGEYFRAYVDEAGDWWVNFGGMTVGHRLVDSYDITGWYKIDQ